ncbi:hypothetical protein GGS26DRAFT_392817 [Hypomontagnella submonticulosa]|nr:hypothetical protein GGS26DRAFT_392817 [Hypomontagnella submonticulosa]
MPPLTSSPLRAIFRRQLDLLRSSRLPRSAPRRLQSSTPGPKPNAAGEAGPKPKLDGVPAADPVPVGSTPVAPISIWSRLGPLTSAGRAYARAQQRRPWATQVVSAVVIYLAADVSAQAIGGKEYVAERTARNMGIGAVSAVPCFVWFVWLSRNFNYPSHALSIAVKIVVNQLVFTPIFNSYFFGSQALLAGDSLAETWDRIRRTVPVSWLNAWKFWPAVTAVNFTFVPIAYRSVFAGIAGVGWQTYMSYLNRQAEIEEEVAHGSSAAVVPAVEVAPLQIDAPKRRMAA